MFLQSGKTKWKYLIIVLIIVVFVGSGILLFQWQMFKEIKLPIPVMPLKPSPTCLKLELDLNLVTTKLAIIPEKYEYQQQVIFSPDGRRVIYVIEIPKEDYLASILVEKNQESELYTSVVFPVFSPDGKKLAYGATNKEGAFVIIENKKGEVYDTVWDPVFSPDSEKVAYAALAKGEMFVVFDNKKSKPYYWVDGDSLIFSHDCQKIAFTARKRGLSNLYFIATVDKNGETESETYDWVSKPKFTPDDKIVYMASNFKSRDKFLIFGDKKIKLSSETDEYVDFSISPDGKKIAYLAGSVIARNMETDEIKKGKIPLRGITSSLVFSPDSQNLAYVVEKNGKSVLILDDEESKPYDYIWPDPVFSPDSQKLAYRASDGEKIFIVINNQESQPYFSYPFPCGLGTPVYAFCETNLIFSPDSKKTAYLIEENGKFYMVVNGKKGKLYDEIVSFQFSSDSKYLGYGAQDGKELWWIVEEIE
ncbi:MAG: hypothetical protein Q8N73_00135 [bacterium]|nr:hypothetical protein [bacterium]